MVKGMKVKVLPILHNTTHTKPILDYGEGNEGEGITYTTHYYTY